MLKRTTSIGTLKTEPLNKDPTRTTEQTKEPYEVLSNRINKKRSWLKESLTKSSRKAGRKNGRPRQFSNQKNHC